MTKPDGSEGWAVDFADMGFEVFYIDLPLHGRSQAQSREAGAPTAIYPSEESVERLIAASGGTQPGFPHLHNKWPGTGLRGDPFFKNYFMSLGGNISDTKTQQVLSCNALVDLLQNLVVLPAFLVAQGSGCAAA